MKTLKDLEGHDDKVHEIEDFMALVWVILAVIIYLVLR